MTHLVLTIMVNAVSLALSVKFINGISFTGSWWTMIGVALIFGLVNSVIKPLLKLLTFPILIITLGLFTLVINALILGLTARLSQAFDLGFQVSGFWPAFKGALLISLINFLAWVFGIKGRGVGTHHEKEP
jgi:putative membrane protein